MSSKLPKKYKVGFANPPKETQFTAGRSGNPKGRPKGTLNLSTVLKRTLEERVVINENGKRQTITKFEAAIKQLLNKAASGDLPALKLLLALATSAEEKSESITPPTAELAAMDQQIMQRMLKKFSKSKNGDQR